MEIVGYDSWKRPIYKDEDVEVVAAPSPPKPKPKPHVNNYVEATPEQMEAWRKEDYWNRGDYDPMVMFVVIPAVIQIMALAMMGGVMYINSLLF